MLTAFPLFLTQAQSSELSPQRAPLTLPLLPLMCLIQRLAAQSQQMAAAPLSPSPTAQNHESWHKGVKQVMAVTGFWGGHESSLKPWQFTTGVYQAHVLTCGWLQHCEAFTCVGILTSLLKTTVWCW